VSDTTDNFPACLGFVWRPENDGQPYHVDANDPGAGTAWGITEATWQDALNAGLVTGDLASASQDDLGEILRANYWHPCQCNAMAAGVDLCIFNMAMIAGPREAAQIVQRLIGTTPDGIIGPITLGVLQQWGAETAIRSLTSRDETYFGELRDSVYFEKGWDRRATDCQTAALAMAGS
jgi:lysozyme family protein